jgi:hypothetical protein
MQITCCPSGRALEVVFSALTLRWNICINCYSEGLTHNIRGVKEMVDPIVGTVVAKTVNAALAETDELTPGS